MSAARYEELADLAAVELELASSGRLPELEELQHRRSELVRSLPASPPPAARDALERVADLQRQTTVALAIAARATRDELRRIGQGRVAARSYAPSAAPEPTVDRAA